MASRAEAYVRRTRIDGGAGTSPASDSKAAYAAEVSRRSFEMKRNLTKLFVDYLDKQKTMALATSGPAGVDCATMFYTYDTDGTIYFSTDAKSVKAKNLDHNSRVALVCDEGAKSPTGVQIRGRATELKSRPVITRIKRMLTQRHPAIEQFLSNPDLRYYKIVPDEKYLINFSWGVDWRNRIE
jgi:uncharacterized protein YhbP (UPF0306 family)